MPEHQLLHVGPRIRKARLQLNLSEGELAQGLCSVDALRRLEEGRGLASVDLIDMLAQRLGVSPAEWLPASPAAPTFAPVRMEIGQSYFLRETYQQILLQVEEQEQDPALPLPSRRSLALVKVDALLRLERVEEALELLLEEVSLCVGRRAPEDKLYLAKLHQRLGQAYARKARTHTSWQGRDERKPAVARSSRLVLKSREEAQMEAYLAYMRGYLLVDKLQHPEASGLADLLADGLGEIADEMGGAREMADRLFDMSSETSEREPKLAFNYLVQAKALYRSLNRREMQSQIHVAMAEVRRQQANPEGVLRTLLREIRPDSMSREDRIRLINSYANAAEYSLRHDRAEETALYLQQASELITEDLSPLFITRTYYTTQAQFLILRGEYERAVEHAMTAYEKAQEMLFTEEAASALRIAADAYKLLGQPGQAVELLHQASHLLEEASATHSGPRRLF